MFIEKIINIFALESSNCEKHFLGFVTWYHYLPSTDFGTPSQPSCDLYHFSVRGADIPLVLAAVIDDLLQLAGLVALAFIIIGSIKFMTSEGNPDNAANARSTIINALAGLAIAVTAIVMVNFIGTHIG